MSYARAMMDSPVGPLLLVASDSGLAGILWGEPDRARVRLEPQVADAGHDILLQAQRQLEAYFAGAIQAFDVPLDFRGTDFQKAVWRALLTIPFGQTRTYRQIATQIGRPNAVRAVGAANGKNPVSIIAPCHRVIGSDGSLTGFAGGLAVKNWLLDFEGAGAGGLPSMPSMPNLFGSSTELAPAQSFPVR